MVELAQMGRQEPMEALAITAAQAVAELAILFVRKLSMENVIEKFPIFRRAVDLTDKHGGLQQTTPTVTLVSHLTCLRLMLFLTLELFLVHQRRMQLQHSTEFAARS